MQPARPWTLASIALAMVLIPPPGCSGDDEPSPPDAAAGGVAVRSPIKSPVRIVELKRAGEHVKKGELVCELDTISLRERLVELQIDARRANAEYLNTKLTREVSEINDKEQEEAIIPADLSRMLSAVSLAKTELALSQQVVTEAKTPEERTQADANVAKGKTRLEEAQTELNTFKTITIPKRKKNFQAEIAKCKVDEAEKLAARDAAETRVKDLKSQIEQCRILAASDGRIIPPIPDADDIALGFGPIEEGATVHERQILFWFVPDPPTAAPKPKSPANN
jgi:HlyD family secretion protein